MKNNNLKNKNKKEVGIAILFAVLLVSIVLTVGLTLLNITVRQLVLSSLARESQFAFYAADSARNCARHYDSLDDLDTRPFGYFALSGNVLAYTYPVTSPQAITCGGSVTPSSPIMQLVSGQYYKASFIVTYQIDATKTTCAEVTVTKGIGGASPPEYQLGKTKIESHGYNNYNTGSNGTSPCYIPSDRTVERAATMVY